MKKIEKITNYPYQQFSLSTEDGQLINIELQFLPRQNGWFIRKLDYNGFVIEGMRVTNSANMLRQFANLIPFGIACSTQGKREPMFLEDFDSGASNLYILTAAECKQYEEYLIETKV